MVTMVGVKLESKSLQQNKTVEREEGKCPKRSLRTRKGQHYKNYSYDIKEKGRWTDEEKKKLLKCLEKYGYQDIEKIAAEIPTRTPLDILFSIRYWKRLAVEVNTRSIHIAKLHSRMNLHKKTCDKQAVDTRRPCNEALSNTESWVDFFEKKLVKDDGSEGVYGLSNIFLTVSKFEAHPQPEEADGLDFQELYLWLNDLINGKPMKQLPGPMMKFIADTFTEISESSKASDMLCQLSHINRTIFHSWKPTHIRTYKRNVQNVEAPEDYVKTMDSIICLPDLNPLEMKLDDGLKKMVNMCKK
ncbi:uncharacterized protein LOC142328596 isoform X2 [Lycorma delicatula]|uniref:uncharacterized protein LOC142328596 isoform X2 n=1 Tax=Lycorma delicatula TaxID=130591 RepID=UPI003F50FAC5